MLRRVMPVERSLREALRNMLQYGDLSFSDFVELALYHPQFGYYTRGSARVGKGGDYVTSPSLSPVFAYALGKLLDEFSSHVGDGVSTVVDIGCGDGGLIGLLASRGGRAASGKVRFAGVDRSLERVQAQEGVEFYTTIDAVPRGDAQLIISNELFDALPFARLVQRGEHLHELWVHETADGLDWSEHEAPLPYDAYFESRRIALDDGQFADVSLEWEAYYGDLTRWMTNGLIVTFDYGYPEEQLFRSRVRRFGTAAAYGQQRVTRDLLANPGEQDLTAHINFTDLQRAGERAGFSTLFFDRQAKFLLALGITEHELFKPVLDEEVGSAEEGLSLLEARDDARRLVLPDGIGHDIRVLVQAKGLEARAWAFEKELWPSR
jgi:SAM-dependent MidA family methyltransferase